MKVLLINGSQHKNGCTYTALSEFARQLNKNGIDTEILHIGTEPLQSCMGCDACHRNGGACVYDDIVNVAIAKAEAADGLVLGSPVHCGSITGAFTTFLVRMFHAGGLAGKFVYKPGATVICTRRTAGTTAIDIVNRYYALANMINIPGQSIVHGMKPEESLQDEEGMQFMRIMADKMAWVLKNIEAGRAAGVELPEFEPKKRTNFIR